MLEYSSILNLNPFAASNLLTPALAAIIVLKVLGVLAVVPAVKLYWAKVFMESLCSKDS